MTIENVFVELELPFILRVPDGSYQCRFAGESFTAALSRVGPPQPATGMVTASVILAPFTGQVNNGNLHTRMSVQFSHDTKDPDERVVSAQQQQMALRYVNAFLDFYRGFFSEPKVRPLDPAEFFEVRYGSGVRFRKQGTQPSGRPKLSMGIAFGDFPLTMMAGSLPEAEVNRFRTELAAACEVSLPESLIMNARSYVSRGSYRLAVVEAGTALDVLVEDVAIRVLVSTGIARVDALKQLEPMSTARIADSIVQPVFDIHKTSPWNNYQPRLRQVRNQVVHDAFQPDKFLAEEFVNMVQGLRDEFVNAKLI